jgi:HSP20 family protein
LNANPYSRRRAKALSERWWKRKRRPRDPWFSDIFEEFDRIEHMMDEMMRQAFEPSKKRDKRVVRKGPFVYGFSMTLGPNGKPLIREFGNIKPKRSLSKTQIREVKEEEPEPLVDVLEQDDEIIVVAQLPGLKREDIDVNVTETQVTISVFAEKRSYHKKLQLPAMVNPESAETSYKNGVLQIKLRKTLLTKTPY